MSFVLNAYAQRSWCNASFITVFVGPFSFVRKSLFFQFFLHVYKN
ncbi:hypothetical protein PS880_01010 [Pseudomonas fluorescens]|uniref:Uncharacterized protein n=1 Tax=Pseudomonas fluorescens TaxID=294 RepID=A0A5E7HMC8_PSEFL|nr:hypothetical protein PS880_01010 [Pseudomonas fluorescens]